MKVLVIPDCHLKPEMFKAAAKLMEDGFAHRAVCLMDIPDDWDQEFNKDLYVETFDAAIDFAKRYPNTLWCYGNHDLCYVWNERESGYSVHMRSVILDKLDELNNALPENNPIKYVQKIDNVIFSHGGVSTYFVTEYVHNFRLTTDEVIDVINKFGNYEMWRDESPIWHRPQYSSAPMFEEDTMVQVVGHTPVEKIGKNKSVISCDVFSTFRDGRPIGTREFLLIDTITCEYSGLKMPMF